MSGRHAAVQPVHAHSRVHALRLSPDIMTTWGMQAGTYTWHAHNITMMPSTSRWLTASKAPAGLNSKDGGTISHARQAEVNLAVEPAGPPEGTVHCLSPATGSFIQNHAMQLYALDMLLVSHRLDSALPAAILLQLQHPWCLGKHVHNPRLEHQVQIRHAHPASDLQDILACPARPLAADQTST